MKGWMKITLIVVGVLIVMGVFYYSIFSSVFQSAPPISRDSYLELNIFGEMDERDSNDPIQKIFAGSVPSLEGTLNCIRKAKVDPKIRGIILRPMGSAVGWAKLEELRDALLDFKESDKPIYVYLEAAGNREYYLACLGNLIFGPPHGILLINGLSANAYFFRESLDKIGIEPDFVAHGKYKNAPDIFTRKRMSPAQREVVNSILDDLSSRIVNTISEERKLEKAEVTRLTDHGFFDLKEAYQNKLIDTLMYYTEFKDYLKEKDKKRVRTVSYHRYLKVPYSKVGIHAKDQFALIYANGTIVSGIGTGSEDGLVSSEAMAESIRKAAKSKKVKAIVFRVNSPGGSGTASEIIWREIVEARKKKPVIVSMSNVAASGGYYISMSADSIIAEPSSIIGSIGVFSGKFSFKKLYEKLGIQKEEIKRGKNADLFSENQTFSTSQRKLMEKFGDDFYRDFVSKVAEGRGLSYQEVDRIAQGRVWTGQQAVKNGLIDRLGGLAVAFNAAKKMTGIPLDQSVRVITYPRKRSIIERILSGELETKISAWERVLPPAIRDVFRGFKYFTEHEPLLLMPIFMEIN